LLTWCKTFMRCAQLRAPTHAHADTSRALPAGGMRLAQGHYPSGGLIPVHWHHLMLADERRCAAFRRAIERVVRPGDVVFDVGAGTGLLSFFAAAKARAVYAVEADPAVAALGRRLVGLNGLEAKVRYGHGRAQDFLPPEPVDVVVCEMLHAALAVEQQVAVLNAVRAGLERTYPGHPFRVVPREVVCYCQLVEAGFDFYGYHAPFVRLGDTYQADPTVRALSPLVPYLHADFGAIVAPAVRAVRQVVADAAGTVTALRLVTQAVLVHDEPAPEGNGLVDWFVNYAVLPLRVPLRAEPGSAFGVEVTYEMGCPLDEVVVTVRSST